MKTFVVRLFVPGTPDLRPQSLQGVVEEIANGRSAAFGDGEELLAFLAAHTAERAAERRRQSGLPAARGREA